MAPVPNARAPLSCRFAGHAGGRIPAWGADFIGWRMYSASLVKKSGNTMKAMKVSSALIAISSMPAMAKLRLLVDFANMADRIRKIRFTPGMEYNINEHIQFNTEGCLLLLFAMVDTPLLYTAAWATCSCVSIYTLYYTCLRPARQTVGKDVEKKSKFWGVREQGGGRSAAAAAMSDGRNPSEM